MGFRRRTRRRAIVAGAAIAHHEDRKYAEAQQAPADNQQAPPEPQYAPEPAPQYAPPAEDPADQIEHFAKLHESGAMTDEEFAAAKAKVLGT
jgi:hypothetical protein